MHSFISKNYFSKLFKEVTGTNVSDYIQYLRVDQACHLLKTTELKVTNIAFQVGFKDMKFFYEVFKKITGKTPGDYRKG
jgi:YesN/AraC family two-component response regulator